MNSTITEEMSKWLTEKVLGNDRGQGAGQRLEIVGGHTTDSAKAYAGNKDRAEAKVEAVLEAAYRMIRTLQNEN